MILWDICQEDFKQDGALRDIYVLNTTIEDWRKTFNLLRNTYTLEYLVDGLSQPVPAMVDEALSVRATASPTLHFNVSGIVVACHFFCEWQIEMDIAPREVTSQAILNELLNFLQILGDILDKPVILCHESDDKRSFVTYEPIKREFQHLKYAA